jgi:hypothetical protein
MAALGCHHDDEGGMSRYIRRYRPAGTTRIGRGGQHFESLVLQIAPVGSDPDKWTTDRITVHIRRLRARSLRLPSSLSVMPVVVATR